MEHSTVLEATDLIIIDPTSNVTVVREISKQVSLSSMQLQDLLLTNAAFAVGRVPGYRSKAGPTGGVNRPTMPLVKRILFSVLRIGYLLSHSVRYLIGQLKLEITASDPDERRSTSVNFKSQYR